MLSDSRPSSASPAPRQTAGDIVRDHLARLAVEEKMRAETRRLEQAELCLSSYSPAARIRAWEKMHGLQLPLKATHPILQVIASATHLTLAEVPQEQHTLMAARTRRLHEAPTQSRST